MKKKRSLNILAPTRYPWRFNGPRVSRHNITRHQFLPLNKIDARAEGITIFTPSFRKYDLIHAFNRIPIGNTPYIIGFESHLPRAFSLENSRYFERLQKSLAGNRCKGIIAISKFSEQIFRDMHSSSNYKDELFSKLEVRYPNLELGEFDDHSPSLSEPIHFVFIGHHFARKGGCVAVRMAELAQSNNIDIKITIVSSLKMGGGIWTDPTRKEYHDKWIERLNNSDKIKHYEGLPNESVKDLLKKAHFCLLPTFEDTFGYSAIEAMSNYCPVIATRQSALPEFITHNKNGILLDLPVSRTGNWIHSSSSERHTIAFEKMFTDEIERLAINAMDCAVKVCSDSNNYNSLRTEARKTVEKHFSAKDASSFWDERYEKAVL